MSDTQGTEPIDQEAENLIQELLDAGFAYEPNGRLAGLAEQGDDGDEDAGEPGEGEGSDDADGGAADDGPGADDGDGDGGTDGGGPAPGVADAGAHTGRLELAGTPLTQQEAETLLGIRKLLIDHPDLGPKFNELVAEKITGRPAGGTQDDEGGTPTPPALPDYIDPDDQQSVRLWNEIQELRNRQEASDTRAEEAVQAAGQSKVQADISAAVDRFKVAHPDLTDEDIANIRNYTSANVNIPGVMSNYPMDPVEGLVKSLEIGSLTDPATRDKVLHVKQDDKGAADKARQADLTKLSGSTGSAPRRPAREKKPASWNEVANRLAKELESMGGTTP